MVKTWQRKLIWSLLAVSVPETAKWTIGYFLCMSTLFFAHRHFEVHQESVCQRTKASVYIRNFFSHHKSQWWIHDSQSRPLSFELEAAGPCIHQDLTKKPHAIKEMLICCGWTTTGCSLNSLILSFKLKRILTVHISETFFGSSGQEFAASKFRSLIRLFCTSFK